MNNQLTLQRINGGHLMRDGALERITDEDLGFSPGGHNLTLGELFTRMGKLQHSYTESLKTLQHDWSLEQTEDLRTVAAVKAWFAELDQAMEAVILNLSEGDYQKSVDRGQAVMRTIEQQLDIYVQAQLIFLGKLVIYFHALEKPLPPSIEHYIG